MRALIAAVVGAVLALVVAFLAVPLADQNGPTTAKPLMSSAPAHP
ncbi:SPW_0924 family protein [Streptacidiphilus fuscans]|uniref:SPW_0924 family protein n=1 Tax=Streptacidiphilus fuscans TaxID=2789292 RepID=A0A931B613_9ACTN|nr:SPW_0924 family protein [Streptacidiphilus fuscans]MBF9070903.1 SPW_0924 family protein [Streptacidiphilus fuscans]